MTTAAADAEIVTLTDTQRVTRWTRPAESASHHQITACTEHERLAAVKALLAAGYTPVEQATAMLRGGE